MATKTYITNVDATEKYKLRIHIEWLPNNTIGVITVSHSGTFEAYPPSGMPDIVWYKLLYRTLRILSQINKLANESEEVDTV